MQRAILPALILLAALTAAAHARPLAGPEGLAAIADEAGAVVVRLEAGRLPEAAPTELDVTLNVEGARLARIESRFFESCEDAFDADARTWHCAVAGDDLDVVVARLAGAEPGSALELRVGDRSGRCTLADLLAEPELRVETADGYVTANLLHHNEIGRIDPAAVGIAEPDGPFSFVIIADSHVGGPGSPWNGCLEATLERVNALEPAPAFVLIVGDSTTGQGEQEFFDELVRILDGCRLPVLLEMGNHESLYKSTFSPGYKMDEFQRYFAAQARINGMGELLYSFDLGGWHFLVCPDPLRTHFWETHPHYLDWVEADLDAHADRPTIFFKHLHPLPLGINPMATYVNSVQVRSRFIDALTGRGDVRWVFSGHTHIPLRSSLKTAHAVGRARFVNLPPTWNPGRNFGEGDPDGTGSAGFTVVHVAGDRARAVFHKLAGTQHPYPDELPQLSREDWPLWFHHEWELSAADGLVNGGFEQGMEGWARHYVYMEDEDPSNVCAVDPEAGRDGGAALHLYCRRRGHYIEGDNRMTQTLNSVRQAVRVQPERAPVVTGWYRLDGAHYTPGDESGACLQVEGYAGTRKRMHLCYWAGRGFFKPGGLWSDWETVYHFDVTAAPDAWHELRLDVGGDYARASEGADIAELGLDRLLVTMRVWTLNQHVESEGPLPPMETGIWFDDLAVEFAYGPADPSSVDGRPVGPKPEGEIDSEWRMGSMAAQPCD